MNRAISCLLVLLQVALPAVSYAQRTGDSGRQEYTFGPDDVIQITVFGRPDFTGAVTVDFRGQIQVPLVGEVEASGRTPSELGEYLTQRYQLLDPSISEVLVSVFEYKSRTVTVVGEVRSPGPYGFVEIPSLWDVILSAGGPSAAADLTRVQIVRAAPRGGQSASILVDLSAGIEGAATSNLPALYPGDKVFIPSAEDVPVGDQDFQIIGAVGAPGTYRITVATNIVEAISASGGPTGDADLESVFLTRDTEDGTQSFKLNITGYLRSANTPQNLDLLAGDTITVPKKAGFITSWQAVSGVMLPLISLAITFYWASNR